MFFLFFKRNNVITNVIVNVINFIVSFCVIKLNFNSNTTYKNKNDIQKKEII